RARDYRGLMTAMTAIDAPPAAGSALKVWPLSVKAYHALGDMGLIPEKTELLYGQIYQKIPKSPLHSALILRLLESLRSAVPLGCHVRQEHPLTCSESEPEPCLSIIRGSIEDYVTEHPPTAELVIEVCVSCEDYDRCKSS